MVFTTKENQDKVVKLMNVIDDMHRRSDISLNMSDLVNTAVAFMIRHLLAGYGNNVVMSYDLAYKLDRINHKPCRQLVVRLMPSDVVITRVWLTCERVTKFYVLHPDSTTAVYDDFRTLLERVGITSWTAYEYIEHAFSMHWRDLESYRNAQPWSKNIIHTLMRYYDHEFAFGKLEPAVTKFIDSVDDVTLQDITQLLESLN